MYLKNEESSSKAYSAARSKYNKTDITRECLKLEKYVCERVLKSA